MERPALRDDRVNIVARYRLTDEGDNLATKEEERRSQDRQDEADTQAGFEHELVATHDENPIIRTTQ